MHPMTLVTPRLVALALAIALPGGAQAATIDVTLSGGVAMAGVNAGPTETDGYFFSPGPVDTLTAARTEEAQADGPFGSGSTRAEYLIDAETGEMRFGLEARVQAGPDGRGTVGTDALLGLTETYFLQGIGRVTLGMELSAKWNAQFCNFQGSLSYRVPDRPDAISNSLLTPIGPIGFAYFDQFTEGPGVGSVDDVIIETVFDVFAPDGGFIDFNWFVAGGVSIFGGAFLPTETAFLDAMNTANIFVRLEGDVSAVAQTAGFLSNPAFDATPVDPPEISVVPLPASAWLLLLGLGALGLAGRRSGAVPSILARAV